MYIHLYVCVYVCVCIMSIIYMHVTSLLKKPDLVGFKCKVTLFFHTTAFSKETLETHSSCRRGELVSRSFSLYSHLKILKSLGWGSVGWVLDSWFWLRSWSHGSWGLALGWVLRSLGSLLEILSLYPSPYLPLSLSHINKS